MASPMVCAEGDLHFEAMVKVPKKLEPVTLGCCIHFPGVDKLQLIYPILLAF